MFQNAPLTTWAATRLDILRVVQHDGRVLAAHLQRHFLEVESAEIAREASSGLGRARERHHVHIHVAGRAAPRLGAPAGTDVEDAGGDTRLHRKLGDTQRGQGRFLGGLDDDRIARGECRADLPGQHQQREIPGQDQADDADGFADDHRDVVVGGRRHLIVDLVDQFCCQAGSGWFQAHRRSRSRRSSCRCRGFPEPPVHGRCAS